MTRIARLMMTLLIAALLSWPGSAKSLNPAPGVQGPQGGPGMGGPGMQAERKILAQFDKDKDKRLNAAERLEARLWLESQPATGPGGRGGRGGPGRGGTGGAMTPGSKPIVSTTSTSPSQRPIEWPA